MISVTCQQVIFFINNDVYAKEVCVSITDFEKKPFTLNQQQNIQN